MTPKRKKMRHSTAAEVMAALAKRYPAGAFALLAQVAPATGHGANTWADAVAVSLWPSRGLELIGIEIKVSRGDWQREYKNPRKNSAMQGYCHRWYLAVGSGDVVQPGELPANWGLLVLRGKVLVEATAAPRLEPKAIDLDLFCALCRRATEGMVPAEAVSVAAAEARTAGIEEGKKLITQAPGEDRTYREAFERLRKHVDAFEKASGLEFLGRYTENCAARIGALAKVLHDHREWRTWTNHAEQRIKAAKEEIENYEGMLKKFSALEQNLPDPPDRSYRGPDFEELLGLPKKGVPAAATQPDVEEKLF